MSAINLKSQTVIACNPTALTPEQLERHTTESPKVFAAICEVRDLPDGYAFRLPADSDMLLKVAEYIRYERICCSFFRFGVDVTPDAIWLRLTGAEGVKAYIAAEIPAYLPREVAVTQPQG